MAETPSNTKGINIGQIPPEGVEFFARLPGVEDPGAQIWALIKHVSN